MVEDKKFKSIIPPGSTNKLIGPGDTVYAYPIDQRSYIIGGAGADTDNADEVTVVSKDNVRLGVRVQVYFTLNRESEDVIKSFHERIGLKTDAYEERAGTTCCSPTSGRRSTVRWPRSRPTTPGPSSTTTRRRSPEFQTAASTEFTRLLPAAVGGDYFCGPSYTGNNACGELSFTIQKPTPLDKGIIDGLEAKQRAELAKQAQEQKNQQVNVELQSVKQQVAMLGAKGYLLKTAIESGKIQFMVIPQNGNVSIPVPTPAQTTTPAQR